VFKITVASSGLKDCVWTALNGVRSGGLKRSS
jgi:hypothetical protein